MNRAAPWLIVAGMAAQIPPGSALAQPADAAKPPAVTAAAATLKAGDKAPELLVEKWLKGEAPRPGSPKVRVLDFWATWCGPCIQLMPHLSELQKAHPKDLEVIGVTWVDKTQSASDIDAWVKKKGAGVGFALALDKDKQTYRAFMTAAGCRTIPTAFVIGKDGVLAFIGPSEYVEFVAPRVLEGTWDPVKGKAEIDAIEAKFKEMNRAAIEDPRRALELLEQVRKEHPSVYEWRGLDSFRLVLLIANGVGAEARALATRLYDRAAKEKDTDAIADISQTMLNDLGAGAANWHKDANDLDLLLKAVQEEIAQRAPAGSEEYVKLAQARHYRGEHAAAAEALEKAETLAKTDDERARVGVFKKLCTGASR